jgi:hypothetical protein
MSAPNNAALAAARETGYRQMADHDKAGLIERLQWACDSDHELAAALRGAAAALQDAAGVVEAMAAREPVGYVVSDAGRGGRSDVLVPCLRAGECQGRGQRGVSGQPGSRGRRLRGLRPLAR